MAGKYQGGQTTGRFVQLNCPAGSCNRIMQLESPAGSRGAGLALTGGPGIRAGALCVASMFPERFLNVFSFSAGMLRQVFWGCHVSCARAVQKTASRGRSPFRLLPLSRAVPSLHGLLCRSQRLAPHGRIQERTAGKTGRTKKRRSGTAQGLQRPALWLPVLLSEGIGTAGRSRYPGRSRRP